MLLVDCKSTYDPVVRRKLLNALKEFKLPKKIVALTKTTLQDCHRGR